MKKFIIEAKWAVIFSIAAILWMVFEKSMGWHDEKIKYQLLLTNLFGIVAFVIYFLALSDKKKNYYQSKMDFKDGFVTGLVLSFFIALLSPLVQQFVYQYVSSNYFENIIRIMVESKKQTQLQATEYFNLKSFTVQGIFQSLSMGVVTGAIVAYFIKTKNLIK